MSSMLLKRLLVRFHCSSFLRRSLWRVGAAELINARRGLKDFEKAERQVQADPNFLKHHLPFAFPGSLMTFPTETSHAYEANVPKEKLPPIRELQLQPGSPF